MAMMLVGASLTFKGTRMIKIEKLTRGLVLALVASGVAAAPASAGHSWGGYHWSKSSSTVQVDLGDNLLKTAASDWPQIFNSPSASDADVVFNWSNLHLFPLGQPNRWADLLETPRVTGANLTSQKRCRPKSGRVEVCNARYGANGWLGLAQVWTSGGHIVQGTAKVNDTYFDSPSYNAAAKQHVLCQEVGHTFGLGHTSEDGTDEHTCMDYDRALDNAHTNAHDNELINAIYAHSHGTTTSSSTSISGNGKARRLGKDLYVEDNGNGQKLFTFVTWVDEAAAQAAPSDRAPE